MSLNSSWFSPARPNSLLARPTAWQCCNGRLPLRPRRLTTGYCRRPDCRVPMPRGRRRLKNLALLLRSLLPTGAGTSPPSPWPLHKAPTIIGRSMSSSTNWTSTYWPMRGRNWLPKPPPAERHGNAARRADVLLPAGADEHPAQLVAVDPVGAISVVAAVNANKDGALADVCSRFRLKVRSEPSTTEPNNGSTATRVIDSLLIYTCTNRPANGIPKPNDLRFG